MHVPVPHALTPHDGRCELPGAGRRAHGGHDHERVGRQRSHDRAEQRVGFFQRPDTQRLELVIGRLRLDREGPVELARVEERHIGLGHRLAGRAQKCAGVQSHTERVRRILTQQVGRNLAEVDGTGEVGERDGAGALQAGVRIDRDQTGVGVADDGGGLAGSVQRLAECARIAWQEPLLVGP